MSFEKRLEEAVRAKIKTANAWMQLSPEARLATCVSLKAASEREKALWSPEVWDSIHKKEIANMEALMRMSPEALQSLREKTILDDILQPPWMESGTKSVSAAMRRDVDEGARGVDAFSGERASSWESARVYGPPLEILIGWGGSEPFPFRWPGT